MSQRTPVIASCPACRADVRFRKAPYLGQYKICPDCDTELEVVKLSPVTVDYLADELELDISSHDDYDDEEDEYAAYYDTVDEEEMERRLPMRDMSVEFDE